MENFALRAIAVMPRLKRYSVRTDALLDRTAADAGLTTERAVSRMLRLIEKKRAIEAAADVCRRMMSVMTERERAAVKGRAEGRTEAAVAEETGVCRSTVHSCAVRALEKCRWVLEAMKKSGYDFSVFAALGMNLP